MPLPEKIYSLNEIGGRKNNEDAIWPLPGWSLPHNQLFMVCDGVGGNSHGEVASEMACKYIAEYFSKNLKSDAQLNAEFVNEAREYAMEHFEKYISEHSDAEKMSTTLTLAYLKAESVFLAWCGDSKIFHIRDGNIVFQSEDHSLVNELIKRGDITAEEAAVHPHRNVITRSLQFKQPYSGIQTEEIKDVKAGDYLLLCSDGVTEKITPEALRSILTPDADAGIIDRFQEYCQGRTRDNYSMYLLKLSQPVKEAVNQQVPEELTKRRSPALIGIMIAIVLLLAAGAYYLNYKGML